MNYYSVSAISRTDEFGRDVIIPDIPRGTSFAGYYDKRNGDYVVAVSSSKELPKGIGRKKESLETLQEKTTKKGLKYSDLMKWFVGD